MFRPGGPRSVALRTFEFAIWLGCGRHRAAAMPDATYPMHVLPMATAMKLERLPTHEAIRSNLVEWKEGMVVLFVSQTWLSYAHPDNTNNDKLRLLQVFLSNAAAGTKNILPNWGAEFNWGRQLKIAAKDLQRISHLWFECVSRRSTCRTFGFCHACSRPDFDLSFEQCLQRAASEPDAAGAGNRVHPCVRRKVVLLPGAHRPVEARRQRLHARHARLDHARMVSR